MKVKKSKFDSSHLCVYLDSSDSEYQEFKPKFDKHGLAFKHERYIFFDVTELKKKKYFNNVHLTFIEAHEIAHTVLNHKKTSRYNEAEADFLAILLCQDGGFGKSEKLGISEFKNRNNIEYDMFSKKYKKDILKKIKN